MSAYSLIRGSLALLILLRARFFHYLAVLYNERREIIKKWSRERLGNAPILDTRVATYHVNDLIKQQKSVV